MSTYCRCTFLHYFLAYVHRKLISEFIFTSTLHSSWLQFDVFGNYKSNKMGNTARPIASAICFFLGTWPINRSGGDIDVGNYLNASIMLRGMVGDENKSPEVGLQVRQESGANTGYAHHFPEARSFQWTFLTQFLCKQNVIYKPVGIRTRCLRCVEKTLAGSIFYWTMNFGQSKWFYIIPLPY